MSNEIIRLIDAASTGNRQAAADLLPLVYGELRKLAAVRMSAESSDQTLQATALCDILLDLPLPPLRR